MEPMARPLGLFVGEVDVGVGRGVKDVDAVELHAPDLGPGSQINHGVEVDRWLRIRPLSDEARPHRIVKLRKIVAARHVSSHAACSFSLMLGRILDCCPELLY